MYKDPVSGLKAALKDAREKREALIKALEKLAAEREQIAESLSHLAESVMEDKSESGMLYKSGMLLGTFVKSVSVMLLTGIVLAQLWNWFLVRPFGLSQLSVVEATGIYLLITLFSTPSKMKSPQTVGGLACGLGITWFLGWLLHFLV